MSILENISLWGGVAGVISAVFSIIILYLTRSNIVDLLDKDAIMYDKVYDLKHNAFQNAFDILDIFELEGPNVRTSKTFIARAKKAYNDLMCTANSPKVYEEFYRLTLLQNRQPVTIQEIANFKTLCRLDIGLKDKKIKKSKHDNSPAVSQIPTSGTMPSQPPVARPMPANQGQQGGAPARPVVRPVTPTTPAPTAPQKPSQPPKAE